MPTINVIHPTLREAVEVDRHEYVIHKATELAPNFPDVEDMVEMVQWQLSRLLSGQPYTNLIGASISADLPETDDLEEDDETG